MKRYGKLAGGIVAAWFVVAVVGSWLQWFRNDSQRIGLAVGAAAAVPILAFAAWYAVSAGFRGFVSSLNPRVLTYVQSWRILGFIFVAMEARGLLPAAFALPAGYGDMFIGATAALAAWKLGRREQRAGFIAWQALGMVDLVTAVSLGITARALSGGPSMQPMTVLPLSLIPTFVVPLLFLFHVISIVQAKDWTESKSRVTRAAA